MLTVTTDATTFYHQKGLEFWGRGHYGTYLNLISVIRYSDKANFRKEGSLWLTSRQLAALHPQSRSKEERTPVLNSPSYTIQDPGLGNVATHN